MPAKTPSLRASARRRVRRPACFLLAVLLAAAAAPGWAACAHSQGGEPASDVAGVRVGMSYEQAVAAVKCDAPQLVIKVHTGNSWNFNDKGIRLRAGFEANPPPEPQAKGTRAAIDQKMAQAQYLVAHGDLPKPGHARWAVNTVGLYGHEQVIAVAHQQHFHTGHDPSNPRVVQALVHKYGPPTDVQTRTWNGQRIVTELGWSYTPAGRRLGPGRGIGGCEQYDAPDSGIHVDSRCGLIISARLTPLQGNQALVDVLSVGSIDEARAYQALVAFRKDLAVARKKRLKAQLRANQAKADNSDI